MKSLAVTSPSVASEILAHASMEGRFSVTPLRSINRDTWLTESPVLSASHVAVFPFCSSQAPSFMPTYCLRGEFAVKANFASEAVFHGVC